ncbi:MAG: hypothetical protein ACI4PQ_06580 [Butyricicoccaceae bacterium]
MYNRYLQQSAPSPSRPSAPCPPPPPPPPCPEEHQKTGKPPLSGLFDLFGKNGGISTEILLLLAVLCFLLLDSDGTLDTELLLIAGLLLLLGI